MSNFDDVLTNNPAEEQLQYSKEEYAEKKQAERKAIFELSDVTALEVAGGGDRFRQYLDVQSTFDRYSAVNALLILAQKPEATRIGSFDHWKSQGGNVNPRATGISILEPHPYTKEDGSQGTGYNLKKVFDISQVDTRKIKATEPKQAYTDRQILQALVSKAPMKITAVDKLPSERGAQTNPETGEISVCRGMEFSDTFRSIIQELGCYEADRDADKVPINPSFVGYCTSYILCKKYGADTQAFNFDAAPEIFKGLDQKGVKQELSIIREAVDAIGERLARQLEAVSKPPKEQGAR